MQIALAMAKACDVSTTMRPGWFPHVTYRRHYKRQIIELEIGLLTNAEDGSDSRDQNYDRNRTERDDHSPRPLIVGRDLEEGR